MSTTLIFGAVYLTICLFCLTMMLFEQRHSQPPSQFYRLAGILAEPLDVPEEQAEARLNSIARGLLGPT